MTLTQVQLGFGLAVTPFASVTDQLTRQIYRKLGIHNVGSFGWSDNA